MTQHNERDELQEIINFIALARAQLMVNGCTVKPDELQWIIDRLTALQSREREVTDSVMLDWLERHYVEVRKPLVHGSKAMFIASPPSDYDDEDDSPSNLREHITAALKESE